MKNTQREAAITSALALRREFTVGEGEDIQVLEKVEVFKYLGRLLAQDDDDVQAIRNQIRRARGTWARLGQVLKGENTSPRVSASFYKAIIQSVLLYGSETWNVTKTALKQLEGFHIRAAYRMAIVNKPKRGSNNTWTYPRTKDVLAECRVGNNRHIHPKATGYNRAIHRDPPYLHRLHRRGAETGVNATAMVVGATDEH